MTTIPLPIKSLTLTPPSCRPQLPKTMNQVPKKPRIAAAPAEEEVAEESAEDEEEEEEALVALIDHRSKEVDQLKKQLHDASLKLRLSQSRLLRLRSRHSSKDHRSSPSPSAPSSNHLTTPLNPGLLKCGGSIAKGKAAAAEVPRKSSAERRVKVKEREHRDLVSSVRTVSKPCLLRFHSGVHLPSPHRRKLRCLELNPVNDRLFATSALDGLVTLWQIQGGGSGAAPLGSAVDCASPGQRRWPEAIAWHPCGDRLFSAYTADNGDAQVSVLDMNGKGQNRVRFLENKPHLRGIINSIAFPWADAGSDDPFFATGGSDHAVVLWSTEMDGEGGSSWKTKALHRNLHSAAVMDIAGLPQRRVLLSVGADKRIIGYDMATGRADYRHQVEHKCMSVLPNPADFNLFMVQTAAPQKQLRLFDIRLRQTEIHGFGWKQESSDSQSALINQSWSPDGWYISSGSADPMIHVFDIRYNGAGPSQSVKAHQKRVFKAAWHQSLPLLVSISSDLNIGLHKIAGGSS